MKETTYINILMDTLRRKNAILDQLIMFTKEQEGEISSEKPYQDRLEELFSKKESLIEQLNLLDSGFDKVYQNVKTELHGHKEQYVEEISILQDLIRTIVEKSTVLQAMELQNKPKFQMYFSNVKKEIKSFKMNSQTASRYYKNVTSQIDMDGVFLDKKN